MKTKKNIFFININLLLNYIQILINMYNIPTY